MEMIIHRQIYLAMVQKHIIANGNDLPLTIFLAMVNKHTILKNGNALSLINLIMKTCLFKYAENSMTKK